MSNLVPKEMQPQDAAVLRHMADLVESGDSFEGSIEYLLPEPPEWQMLGEPEPEDYEHRDYRLVRGTFRTGNLMGQGGVTMIGDVPLVPPPERVAEHTVAEAEQQLRKAALYFSTVLANHDSTFLACKVDGVTMVVAVDSASETLRRALTEERLFGVDAKINEPPVVLIPRYHEPSGEFAGRTGNIHLHVLNDAKLGRRVRKSGECLCGKKRGKNEREPTNAAPLCIECVRVAQEHGLDWAL